MKVSRRMAPLYDMLKGEGFDIRNPYKEIGGHIRLRLNFNTTIFISETAPDGHDGVFDVWMERNNMGLMFRYFLQERFLRIIKATKRRTPLMQITLAMFKKMCRFIFIFLLFSLLSAVLIGVSLYERMRWLTVQEACQLTRENHIRLIQSDVCKSGYGSSMESVCEKAQVDLRTGLLVCTALSFWKQSEVYSIYMRITESYLMLTVLILVPLLYTIHKVFDTFQRSNAERIAMDTVQRVMYPMQHHQLLSQPSYPSYIEEPTRRRPRSQFVYEVSNRDRDD